ncbi:uncharacterized protein [Littorina saxatilis]|uniref:Thyroglobulin type-1 domain-containing protein n=1 Tax=Littorina saxatilis TaxID=31220 RepID=A0AAN9ATK8_9CAEN
MLRLVIVSLAFACANAIVCTKDVCQLVRCAAVTAENCVGGSIVANGGFCGCCDSCVQSLGAGDQCFSSLLLGVPSTAKCASGLYCDPTTSTCKKIPNLQTLGKRAAVTCAERVNQMQLASTNGLPLLGQFIPQCETDGSYSARQCKGSVCYCVDASGSTIQGYSANIGQAASMDCKCARDQSDYMKTGLIGKLFSCTDSGSYQRYQCVGSVCFCADNLGNMQQGSPSVNIGNIGALQC